MSKLADFYNYKASLLEKGEPIDPQWEKLEDQLLKKELLPELIEQLRSVLSKVKSPLMFCGSYDPDGCLSISFTINCMQMSALSSSSIVSSKSQGIAKEEEINVGMVTEPEITETPESVVPETRNAKAKSIGFSVYFRDGTICHESKAVYTWIKALKKIGLENICNNRSRHKAWHRVNGRDISIVERTETLRDSDGKSPQILIDGFYVMAQLSNDQKVKDLLALGEYMPKLGIKVVWDDEVQGASDDVPKAPVVNEDASRWNYPIMEQFRSFLLRQKAESTANSYISTLDNAVRQWINQIVDASADSVFSYTTTEDVRLCIDMLNDSPEYVAENDRKHHSMSASLNQYLSFIQEWEKNIKD